jgi:uncharacterized membrane protein
MAAVRNKVAWISFATLAICIGLYPLIYLFVGDDFGLLSSKSKGLLQSVVWKTGFIGHILFGGLALLSGWSQFSGSLRKRNLKLHRKLGKFYSIVVGISGICGLYLSFYATGGLISGLGFFALAVLWLFFTFRALLAIKKGDVRQHQAFMIYSYAACFAAVTLRIWLPLLSMSFGDFVIAYRTVAWLCWVPNLVFAYFWVKKQGLQLE